MATRKTTARLHRKANRGPVNRQMTQCPYCDKRMTQVYLDVWHAPCPSNVNDKGAK